VRAPGDIFEGTIEFDPGGDLQPLLKSAPPRWAVYLLADEHDRPVQLLCVRNLRASLKRRLEGHEPIGPSRRVDYRQIVRRIHYRRVDSAFEADVVYLEAARTLFPDSYQGMVGFRPAWFIHVNPQAEFPRYTKTIDLSAAEGMFIGPVEDKHAAARLIELVEDAFDLCRYYKILIEAPRGRACAYKEMGRCPAPCDGSISMQQYRAMIAESAAAIIDPAQAQRAGRLRMEQAAAALQFESAARIKAMLDRLGQLGTGAFRHARRLEDFRFVSLQRGPRDGTAKLFLVTPGSISEVAGLIAEPTQPADLLRHVLALAAGATERLTPGGIERIGLVSQHLFAAKNTNGVFVRLSQIDEKALARAFRDLRRQKAPEESETEGASRELEAM